jgi:Ca2+-binding RTX toxin-like protein
MVKVVARQPVDAAALEALRTVFDPDDAVFSGGRPNRFTVQAEDIRADVTGSGFEYFPFTDTPQAGMISGISIRVGSELAYTIRDAGIDIGKMIDNPPKPEAAARKLFSGKDSFKGSDGDDTFAGGGGSDKLAGRGGDDELHGDAGKDELDGGAGADSLDGGGGRDTYVFRDSPESGIDTIARFDAGETLELARSAFAGIGKGDLASGQFVEGTEAEDANDRFIYDPSTGAVYHDPDGAGGTAQVQFCRILVDRGNFGSGDILVV